MDPILIGLFVAIITIIFLFSGMPIAFALGLSAMVVSVVFGNGSQFSMLAHFSYDTIDSFALLAIPLFILMGNSIASSPAGNDLYDSLDKWLRKIPGSLVISNIFSCGIFAAMCGSSPATAVAIGTTGIPQMIKRGIPEGLATGSIVGGGTLGILIPPSVTLIVYGIATEASIGKLFLAGVLPGLLIVNLFSLWAWYFSYSYLKRQTVQAGTKNNEENITLNEKLTSLIKVIPFVLIIVVIMVSLYGGIATPSESAAVGALFALALVFLIYKSTNWKTLVSILLKTCAENTMICFILVGSDLFGNALSSLYITQSVATMIVNLEASRWVLFIIINLFLLILGCFIPPVAIILITAPILHPIITALNFDPIWFGIVMTLNMEAGLITPPMGVNLYVVKSIAPDIDLKTILIGSMPFFFILIISIVLISLFPGLATWLPNKMF